MKRPHLIGIGILTGLAIAIVLTPMLMGLANEAHPVRAYVQIQLGMTRGEVEAIVGLPPGNYETRTRPPPPGGCMVGGPSSSLVEQAGVKYEALPPDAVQANWSWNEHWIRVHFDQQGRVMRTERRRVEWFDPPTLFDRVRQWLGW